MANADPFQRLDALYENRHKPAAEGGAGTIGCVGHAVPVELVLAADLTPVRIHGDPSRPPTRSARYMEDEADGDVRSVFDRMLESEFAGLDMVLLPRDTEMHLQLHHYIAEVRRWEPQARIPEIMLVDVMQTAYHLTSRYVRARLDALAAKLGTHSGSRVTDESLREAIAATNAARRALSRLNDLRRDRRVNGSTILRAAALFATIPMSDLTALCGELAAAAGSPSSAMPLAVSGSLQDTPEFFEIVESAGGHVTADDHVAGERLFAHLVDEDMDPMEALTAYYQLHCPGVRQFPQAAQDRRFLDSATSAGVRGHICFLEEGDDTLGWDYPPRRKALSQAGIPSLLMTKQDYFAPDRAAQAEAVKAFLVTAKEAAA